MARKTEKKQKKQLVFIRNLLQNNIIYIYIYIYYNYAKTVKKIYNYMYTENTVYCMDQLLYTVYTVHTVQYTVINCVISLLDQPL